MTQLEMIPRPAIYVIDANCIIGLNNRHSVLPGHKPQPEFAEDEHDAIWAGLGALAIERRIKIVRAVADEIRRRDPQGWNRLKSFGGISLRVSNNIRLNYQRLVERYPDWGVRGDEMYEQGDPWLIAHAMERGYTVVTNEKPRAVQRAPRRGRTKIPDVCDSQSIPWCTFRKLANDEGWI